MSRWEQWSEDIKGKYQSRGLDVGSLMDLSWHISKCPKCLRHDVQVVIMRLYEPNGYLLRRANPVETIGPLCVKCHDWSRSRVLHPAFMRPEIKYRKGQLQRAVTNGLSFEPDEDFAALTEPPDMLGGPNRWVPKKFLVDAWSIQQ